MSCYEKQKLAWVNSVVVMELILHFVASSVFPPQLGTKFAGRKPCQKQPAGHLFSTCVWLFSFFSREESGDVLWQDLPGRPGWWVDGGEPCPAAQGWWPNFGKASWECVGEGVACRTNDFDLLGKPEGMVPRARLWGRLFWTTAWTND